MVRPGGCSHVDLINGIHVKLLTQALAVAKQKRRQVAIGLVTSWQNYRNPVPDYLMIAWIDMCYYGFRGEGHRLHAAEPWPA